MRDSKWSSEEQDTYEIDLKKPLLSQVCKLGSRYDEWVHKPVAGKPTHFENPWLESFLRVPWWLIPAIWVPLTLAFAGSSLWLLRPNLTHWLSLVMAGLLSWQFIEYSIHRWLFHAKAESPGFIRFHFLHHGAHHKFPMDKGNLVMHPLPSLLIAAVLAAFILSLVQVPELQPGGAAAPSPPGRRKRGEGEGSGVLPRIPRRIPVRPPQRPSPRRPMFASISSRLPQDPSAPHLSFPCARRLQLPPHSRTYLTGA
mmetsp:Transcript_15293/g.36401  ORF Transcript_15293/g.36401 Transcript_15293/m.36401 type:complete len:255 (-) Transcript_15293:271-1035(-)